MQNALVDDSASSSAIFYIETPINKFILNNNRKFYVQFVSLIVSGISIRIQNSTLLLFINI
jgi:hypothetical protein